MHRPDGRALSSFDQSLTMAGLELMMADALESDGLSVTDRAVFAAIAGILRSARRSESSMLVQRNIIVVETKRRTRNRRSA